MGRAYERLFDSTDIDGTEYLELSPTVRSPHKRFRRERSARVRSGANPADRLASATHVGQHAVVTTCARNDPFFLDLGTPFRRCCVRTTYCNPTSLAVRFREGRVFEGPLLRRHRTVQFRVETLSETSGQRAA